MAAKQASRFLIRGATNIFATGALQCPATPAVPAGAAAVPLALAAVTSAGVPGHVSRDVGLQHYFSSQAGEHTTDLHSGTVSCSA